MASPHPVLTQLQALNGAMVHFHVIGYSPEDEDDPDAVPGFSAEYTIPQIVRGSDLEAATWFFGNLLLRHVQRAYETTQVPPDTIWIAHTLCGMNMN